MSAEPFGRRRALLVALAAALSLGAAAFLGVFGDELSEPQTYEADGFSPSAIGHRAFVALLRDVGFRVLVSRHRTADKAADGAVIVLAEPVLEHEEAGPREAILEDVAAASTRLLVVLPKRRGLPDPQRPRWLAASELVDVAEVERVLAALGVEARVVRSGGLSAPGGELPTPSLDGPQLLRSDQLVPLVAWPEGMVAGELREGKRHLVVLADPDVVANHGLGDGDNAALAVRLLERLGAGEAPVVVDETLHGLELRPSVARELFRFPLVLATLQALLAAALLAWAALVRFGRPHRPPPLLAPGKEFLVANTAELLRHAGDLGDVLASYLRAAKDEIARRLRPGSERSDGPDAWLARLAAARGRGDALAALEERVRAARGSTHADEAVRAAQAIHAWREELTHGHDGDPRRHRTAQG